MRDSKLRRKTLRQYRKEQMPQKDTSYQSGSDWEDLLLLEPPHHALPEQALWRAVLLQMLTDALSNSQKPDQKRHKRDALYWLRTHSRDFRIVCEHAGFNAEWMQMQIDRFLERHHQSPASIAPTCRTKTKPAGFSVSYQFKSQGFPVSFRDMHPDQERHS